MLDRLVGRPGVQRGEVVGRHDGDRREAERPGGAEDAQAISPRFATRSSCRAARGTRYAESPPERDERDRAHGGEEEVRDRIASSRSRARPPPAAPSACAGCPGEADESERVAEIEPATLGSCVSSVMPGVKNAPNTAPRRRSRAAEREPPVRPREDAAATTDATEAAEERETAPRRSATRPRSEVFATVERRRGEEERH